MKRRKRLSGILISIALVVFIALGILWKVGPRYGFFILPPSPEDYGRYVLRQLEQGINTGSPEWAAKKKEYLQNIRKAQTYDEVDAYVDQVVKIAGGESSELISRVSMELDRVSYIAPVVRVDNEILYIRMPTVKGTKSQKDEYRKIIADAVMKKDYKAVIIDLRGNEGGDLGPMMAPLAPFYPKGEIIRYSYSASDVRSIKAEKGVLYLPTGNIQTGTGDYMTRLPIAFLQDGETRGNAEQLILSFNGLYNVRTFGSATAGFPTVRNSTTLMSGNVLMVTTGIVIDRRGIPYRNSPLPAIVEVSAESSEQMAREWLMELIRIQKGQ